jgi:folate-binding protein YgfZ
MGPGYIALREGAAWLDLSGRGRIRMTGEDRVRLLHAMCTNDVQHLAPGAGCYTFFLNAQGRILADANVLCHSGALLLDTEPEAREFLLGHIDRYIIADDVALEDATAATAAVGLEGPKAEAALAAAGAPAPEAGCAHVAWGDRLVVRASTTGMPGFAILTAPQDREALLRTLEAAGAVAATPAAARTVRIEAGKPRYGEDITDRFLPHETQLLHAVHFTKGCYLGQEIVERVRSRGGVHRFLVRMELEAGEPPVAGTPVLADDKTLGEITSAAYSPSSGKVAALGYVRLEEIKPGMSLRAAGYPVAITATRPASTSE